MEEVNLNLIIYAEILVEWAYQLCTEHAVLGHAVDTPK